MSDQDTSRMIKAYNQTAPLSLFLTGLFQMPPENFHTSKDVEIDIEREDESIAVVVSNLTTGYRMNELSKFTNKRFTPPVLKEGFPITAFDLMNRNAGENPFQAPDFQKNAVVRVMKGSRVVQKKILRSIELQASQVLQTGKITLNNFEDDVVYEIDYSPNASHFPVVAVGWDQAGADPLGDIEALANEIRNDGLLDPNQLIMGETAFENFIKNESVQKRLDNRRIELGAITPMKGDGGTGGGNYRGTVEVGNYKFDIWTYGGRYIDPASGDKKLYLDANKVIVRAATGRLDATFGAIPRIVPIDQQLLPMLPSRINEAGTVGDISLNAWISEDGETFFGGAGSRPLLIPTAIDTYGCLDTEDPA